MQQAPGEGDGETDNMVRNSTSLYNPHRGGPGGGAAGVANRRSKGVVVLVVGLVALCLFGELAYLLLVVVAFSKILPFFMLVKTNPEGRQHLDQEW